VLISRFADTQVSLNANVQNDHKTRVCNECRMHWSAP
jgi:hypothetical protein